MYSAPEMTTFFFFPIIKFSHSLTCLCVTEIIDAKQLVVPSSQKTVAVLEGQTGVKPVSKITQPVSSKWMNTWHVQRKPHLHAFYLKTDSDLSEADSLDNVFVCECEDLISTHCIPHLSENRVSLLTQDFFVMMAEINIFNSLTFHSYWLRPARYSTLTLWSQQQQWLPWWRLCSEWLPRQRLCDPETFLSSPLCLPGATWACHLAGKKQRGYNGKR